VINHFIITIIIVDFHIVVFFFVWFPTFIDLKHVLEERTAETSNITRRGLARLVNVTRLRIDPL